MSEVDADVTQTKGMLQFVDVLNLLAEVDGLAVGIIIDADIHTTERGLVCLDAVEQSFAFFLVFLQHPMVRIGAPWLRYSLESVDLQ